MKYQRTGRPFLLLLAGVFLSASVSAAERTVTIDESFDGGLINLAVDETLAVRLPACAAGKCSVSKTSSPAPAISPAAAAAVRSSRSTTAPRPMLMK